MIKNQKGFGVVEVLIVVIVIALLGFGGWYIFSKNNDSKKTETTNSQQTENGDTEDTKTPKNTVTLKVDDYSLTLNVPETLADLQIASSRDSTFEGKEFTQATLATDEFKQCSTPGGVLGTVSKLDGTYSAYPFGTLEGTEEGVYVKQLDSFYLMYQAPQSHDCNGMDASDTYNKVKQAIIDNNWTHKTN